MSPAALAFSCSASNSASVFTDTQIFLKRPSSHGSSRSSSGLKKFPASWCPSARIARIEACAPCATILPLRMLRSLRRTIVCLCSTPGLAHSPENWPGISLRKRDQPVHRPHRRLWVPLLGRLPRRQLRRLGNTNRYEAVGIQYHFTLARAPHRGQVVPAASDPTDIRRKVKPHLVE